MVDANQTSRECYRGSSIKPHTIEWLKTHRGMEDPFISLVGSCPNSTTINPQHNIVSPRMLTAGNKTTIDSYI
jgi:hypothetical protein